MKILWVTCRSFSDLCATSHENLIQGLVNRGHEVVLLNPDSTVELSVTHHGFSPSGIPGRYASSLAKQMKNKIRSLEYDVAVLDWRLISLAPLIKTPWALLDRSVPAYSGLMAKLQWRVWRKAWKLAKHGFVVSRAHKDFLDTPADVEIITAGVDLDVFKPGDKDEVLTLIYHGRLDKNRGVLSLPMLQRKLKNQGIECKLKLIGAGDCFKTLQSFEDVELHSTMSHEELAKHLSSAHVGLLPMPDDQAWRLASPLKLSEYAASGLAILGIDHSGHQLVEADWLKLVSQDDFHDKGVEWIVSNPSGEGAREFAETSLSWAIQVDKIESKLQAIIDS